MSKGPTTLDEYSTQDDTSIKKHVLGREYCGSTLFGGRSASLK